MQWRTSFSVLVADGSENEFAQLKQSLGHSYIFFPTFRNRQILTLNIEFKHIIKENSKGISKFRTQKDINEK